MVTFMFFHLNHIKMRSIMHTIEKATLAVPHIYSFSLKAAYLLSDETVSIGVAVSILNYLHNLNKLTIKEKCIMLRDSYNKETDSEEIDRINLFLSVNKLKHVPNEIFIAIKGMESFFNKDFRKFYEDKKDIIEKLGFYQLDHITDGINFGFLYMKEDFKKSIPNQQYVLDVEALLQMDIPDTDSSENILVLNDWFYREEIIQGQLFQSPLDESVSGSYIYPVLQLPGIQNYTKLELQTTRSSLTEPLKEFRKLISEWSVLCNTSEDKTESLQFFKEKIVPIATSADDVIKNHPVMKYHLEQFKTTYAYILFGEVTKELLLNYYRHVEYINEEKYQKLTDKYKAANTWDRRVPYMFISTTKIPGYPSKESIQEEEIMNEIKASRKFISLD